jgi:hypothetical protein
VSIVRCRRMWLASVRRLLARSLHTFFRHVSICFDMCATQNPFDDDYSRDYPLVPNSRDYPLVPNTAIANKLSDPRKSLMMVREKMAGFNPMFTSPKDRVYVRYLLGRKECVTFAAPSLTTAFFAVPLEPTILLLTFCVLPKRTHFCPIDSCFCHSFTMRECWLT